MFLRYSIRNQKSQFLLEIESDINRDFLAPPKQFCPLKHFAYSHCHAVMRYNQNAAPVSTPMPPLAFYPSTSAG